MKRTLTMLPHVSRRSGPIYGTGEPVTWKVQGLPPGEDVFIIDAAGVGVWRIARVDGKGSLQEGEDQYETADQALDALQQEYND